MVERCRGTSRWYFSFSAILDSWFMKFWKSKKLLETTLLEKQTFVPVHNLCLYRVLNRYKLVAPAPPDAPVTLAGVPPKIKHTGPTCSKSKHTQAVESTSHLNSWSNDEVNPGNFRSRTLWSFQLYVCPLMLYICVCWQLGEIEAIYSVYCIMD